MKCQKIIRGQGNISICSCDPEIIDYLELIFGSIEAGNNNPDLIN